MITHRIQRRLLPLILAPALTGLAAPGCEPARSRSDDLPPAYTSNKITDGALLRTAEEIRTWALEQTGAEDQPLYSKVEVLPPVPTVQPYGVGVYQQELRLPVILTTGPGWPGLSHAEKEEKAAGAFREADGRLKLLERSPALQPTLTIQTPQGLELAWMNRLDPGANNVHGDE